MHWRYTILIRAAIILLLGIILVDIDLYHLGRKSHNNEISLLLLRQSITQSAFDVYAFDQNANRLMELFFPEYVVPSGFNKAYEWRGRQVSFETLDDILADHDRGVRASEIKGERVYIGRDNMESYWCSIDSDNVLVKDLLSSNVLEQVEALALDLSLSKLQFRSPLEKALFQRDTFHIFSALSNSSKAESKNPQDPRYRAMRALATLMQRLLLTEDEYRRLREMLPKKIDESRFVTKNKFDLADDYLPNRVLKEEKDWFEVPFIERASIHFIHFGGRSFVHVYIKPTGMTEQQFHEYWDLLYKRFGTRSTTAHTPPLPAGTETLLIRTFGVFLSNWIYADSGFPEEVIMRLFKYQKHTLDLSTSDYRGTLLYQYKMQRRALLDDVKSLGLRRKLDDEPSYSGFNTEAPDWNNAIGDGMLTMRHNCIQCHSLQLYGSSTIFSLARERPRGVTPDRLQNKMLEAMDEPSRYKLKTQEFEQLKSLLGK